MSRYKTYSDTKLSAISWLDKIPSWWDEKRLKYLFIQQSRPVRAGDSIVTCFRDGQVTLRSNRRTEGFTNALKEHGYQGVKTGDLVIHSMDAFAGAIGVSDSDGKMSPVCTIALPAKNGTMTRFYAYMLRAMAITGFIESLAKGIRERSTDFRWGEAREVTLPVPTDTEQSQIATFLDRETTRIDTLIEKKQRFIELLEEKRQAVITQAVTKGLDPNVPMKDSGVAWIGEVPAHWEVVPIYGMARCNTKTLPETALESEGSFEYIDISAVDHILGIADGEQVEFKMAPSRARRLAEEGDVIISTVRTYLKAVAEVRAEKSHCVFSTGFAVLSPLSHLAPDILKWILLNDLLIQAIEAHSQGLSYPAINTSRLLRLAAALPPQDEQSHIATFLDRETTRIDTLIEKTRESIELLKERRSALITAAVTGKIDVREEAA